MRVRALSLVFALSGGLALFACGSEADVDDVGVSEEDVTVKTNYDVDLSAYNRIYNSQFTSLDDAYSVLVRAGDVAVPAPTHLFGEAINVIPYANQDLVRTADRRTLKRGDSIIAQVYTPGQVGIAIKHHRSEYPVIDLSNGAASLKEHLKLQDTHIEIVVGVVRDGVRGAVTLNNPQSYEQGLFGDERYAMVFVRPVYPSYLSAAQQRAFEDNVRTLLVGFNAVTNFPGDYNGGDPLGARDPEKVREASKQMVLAITGSAEARAWFMAKENQVYCAELAFLSFSAGLHVPLNDATMEPLVGAEAWSAFKALMERHNQGESTPFTELNDNQRVRYIRNLAVAPADLRPAASYGPAGEQNKLALQPLTGADIVEEFLRTHVPREQFGESLAPLQASILQAMKPGLLEQLGFHRVPETDPARVRVDQLFDALVQVIGQSYGSYAEYRAALEPLLQEARVAAGPRGDSGEGLYVPPSLFHVAAQGKRSGLLSFQYEGHGVHVSAVKRAAKTRPLPTPVEKISSTISCVDRCGGPAPGGCFCDAQCEADPSQCCADYASACQ